jgi:hypothetical protein
MIINFTKNFFFIDYKKEIFCEILKKNMKTTVSKITVTDTTHFYDNTIDIIKKT